MALIMLQICTASSRVYEALTTIGKEALESVGRRSRRTSTENSHGFKSRTQAERAHHHWLMRGHQYRSARPAFDRRRQDSDPAREGYPDTGNRRYSGQADLSRRATDVSVTGSDGASPDLFQPGAGHPERRAERMAFHRRDQQSHPQWRSVSRTERSEKADRSRRQAHSEREGYAGGPRRNRPQISVARPRALDHTTTRLQRKRSPEGGLFACQTISRRRPPRYAGAPPDRNRLHRQRRRSLDFQNEAVGRRRSLRAEFQHRRDQSVDIAGVGAVIDDCRAYRELAVEKRRRWRRNPGFLNGDDDIAVDPVGVGGAITEANDIQLDRRQQLQPRLGQDPLLQIFGKRAGARDHRSELFQPEGFQGEPRLERPEASGQIGPEVAGPG